MSRVVRRAGTSVDGDHSRGLAGAPQSPRRLQLPVNVAATATKVATLGSKFRNNLESYSGLLVVDVAKNNRSTASRQVSYLLHIARSADWTGAINVVSFVGEATGASAANPSFTFTFDPASSELRATHAGSTVTGNWYSSIATLGNLSITP